MEAVLEQFFSQAHWLILLASIGASLLVLGKAADLLVGQAVELSKDLRIPPMVVGATVVSLGTTAPEAAVSVLAAVEGAPGLALGNSVGSVIADTGLILGLACLVAPLKLDPGVVGRQGWIQVGSGVLLVILSTPWTGLGQVFTTGGTLPQEAGFLLLALLAAYLYLSVRWAGRRRAEQAHADSDSHGKAWLTALKLIAALAGVIVSAQVVIPGVTEAAARMSVPDSVVAATLVAFGTSLPELVTALTAARRGHGELAVGNVIGADILNVLFVAGASAAVTRQGLAAGPDFFTVLYPAMLSILIIFRVGVFVSGEVLHRGFGFVLIAAYIAYIVAGYWLLPGGVPGH